MAVDFAYKQRMRGNEGFALKNIKLRLSRKPSPVSWRASVVTWIFQKRHAKTYSGKRMQLSLLKHLQGFLKATPLEILARLLLRYPKRREDAKALFSAYDEFLGLLSDKDVRARLEGLAPEDLNDPTFQNARSISHRFRNALHSVFLENHSDNVDLYRLMIEYGVF